MCEIDYPWLEAEFRNCHRLNLNIQIAFRAEVPKTTEKSRKTLLQKISKFLSLKSNIFWKNMKWRFMIGLQQNLQTVCR